MHQIIAQTTSGASHYHLHFNHCYHPHWNPFMLTDAMHKKRMNYLQTQQCDLYSHAPTSNNSHQMNHQRQIKCEYCYILPNVSFNNEENKDNGGITKAASGNPKTKVSI